MRTFPGGLTPFSSFRAAAALLRHVAPLILTLLCLTVFPAQAAEVSAGTSAALPVTDVAGPEPAPATAPAPLAPGQGTVTEAPAQPIPQAVPAPLPVNTSPQGVLPGPGLIQPKGGLALTPFLSYYLDSSGDLNLNEAREQKFLPFNILNLPRQAGTLWLRFVMNPTRGEGQPHAVLDLGDQVPARPQVWARNADGAMLELALNEDNLFALDSLQKGGEVFIRLDGLPGLWFTPMLHTPAEAMVTLERKILPLTVAALAVLLMLCLLRSFIEGGDWRFWAGIFAGAALLHIFAGIPSTPHGKVLLGSMPGILGAGVALMLLPHVGRHIMRTREYAPTADVILLFLALPGACLALVPMLPDLAWTARLLALWPLGAVLSLGMAVALRLKGVPGSGLFLLACLGMCIGAGASLLGIGGQPSTPVWALGPLFGVTFATLLIAASAPRNQESYEEDEEDESEEDEGLALLPSAIVTAAPADEARRDDGGRAVTGQDAVRLLLRAEEVLRQPLETLLREACMLDQRLDGPSVFSGKELQQVRRHAEAMVTASRDLSARLANLPRTVKTMRPPRRGRVVFNLQQLVQHCAEKYADEAADKNVGFAWHLAPHLSLMYKGDAERLAETLELLLGSAVRGTARGMISLRVRRDDKSPNPGRLHFSVLDTGHGTPLGERSSLALARAWELASDHNGDLYVDSTPTGVEISLTLQMEAMADDAQAARSVPPEPGVHNIEDMEPSPARPGRVIVASAVPLNRELLSYYLDGMETWEARDAQEAVALYTHAPSGLLVLDGNLPEEEIVAAVAAIRVFEGEYNLPAVPVLALTSDDEQVERLHLAGCDHALAQPVNRGEFRAMVQYLTEPGKRPAVMPFRSQGRKGAPREDAVSAPRPATPRAGEARPDLSRLPSLSLEPEAPSAPPISETKPVMPLPLLDDAPLEHPAPQNAPLPEPEPVLPAPAPVAPVTKEVTPPAPGLPLLSLTPEARPEPAPMAVQADPTPVAPEPVAPRPELQRPTQIPAQRPPHKEQPRVSAVGEARPHPPSQPPLQATQPDPVAPVTPITPITSVAPLSPDTSAAKEKLPLHVEPPKRAESADMPKLPEPAEALPLPVPATSDRRPAAEAETAAETPQEDEARRPARPVTSGLVLPKKKSWLASLFSPRDKAEPLPKPRETGEWVGEPVPAPKAAPTPEEEGAIRNEEAEILATQPAPTTPADNMPRSRPALPPDPSLLRVSDFVVTVGEPVPAPKTGESPAVTEEEQPGPEDSDTAVHVTLDLAGLPGHSEEEAAPTLTFLPPQSPEIDPETSAAALADAAAEHAELARDEELLAEPEPAESPESDEPGEPAQPVSGMPDTPLAVMPEVVEAVEIMEVVEVAEAEPEEHVEVAPLPGADLEPAPEPLPEAAAPDIRDALNSPDAPEFADSGDAEDEAEVTLTDIVPASPLAELSLSPVAEKPHPKAVQLTLADIPLTPRPARPEPVAEKKPDGKRLERLSYLSLDPDLGLDDALSEQPIDLTEADVLDSPLLQQESELTRSLRAALDQARQALARDDADSLYLTSARMADRAVAFGLHNLADLAHCLREAAQNHDMATVEQLLPDLEAEIARNAEND